MSSSSSPIELTILSVKLQDSHVQDKVRRCAYRSKGLFAYLYVHHVASHVYVKKKSVLAFHLSFNLVKVQLTILIA